VWSRNFLNYVELEGSVLSPLRHCTSACCQPNLSVGELDLYLGTITCAGGGHRRYKCRSIDTDYQGNCIIFTCLLTLIYSSCELYLPKTSQLCTALKIWGPWGPYLPVWYLNLDNTRRYPFRSNSNKFIINSAKRKFTYLPAERICYLVSNQGSPVTILIQHISAHILTFFNSLLESRVISTTFFLNIRKPSSLYFCALRLPFVLCVSPILRNFNSPLKLKWSVNIWSSSWCSSLHSPPTTVGSDVPWLNLLKQQ